MKDNRIFSKMACTVCGRLGEPHAEWCAEMTAILTRKHAVPWNFAVRPDDGRLRANRKSR